LNDTASRARRAAAAAGLAAVGAYLVVAAVFSRLDWADTVAYGLPGANLVRLGSLTLPQLGSQFGFDRFWLFNAPWLAVGNVPAFWIAGVGRVPHLAGIAALGALNYCVFTVAARRLFDVSSIAAALLVAFAFLDTRGLVTSDLFNQKYSVAAYALLLVAFLPISDPRGACGRPWWQWLAAGVLPLVHIVLPPASIVWAIVVVASDRSIRHRSLAGPALFGLCGVASAVWYLRPEPFEMQLWPHIAYGGFRQAGRFSGLFDVAASPLLAIPTWTLAIATVAAAGATAVRTLRRDDGIARAAMPAAALILVVLVVDAWRGFLDYGFFIAGVGPIVFAAAAPRGRSRALVASALAIAGAVNLGVSTRLDRLPPRLATTHASEAFVTTHTNAHDRIILGPPFVFAASTLGPARTVPRVVPQPYYLERFDRDAYVRELNACCDVYVGEEDAYRRVTRVGELGEPIFANAAIDTFAFEGRTVLVARRR
jgi:hypothetical protein